MIQTSTVVSVLLAIMATDLENDLPGEMHKLDFVKLARIESSMNPEAYNKKTKATGLFQITPVVVKEYNERFKTSLTLENMKSITISTRVAIWYADHRIPQILRYYKRPVTTQTILWCWNAGIGKYLKGIMPEETREFINKYNKLAR